MMLLLLVQEPPFGTGCSPKGPHHVSEYLFHVSPTSLITLEKGCGVRAPVPRNYLVTLEKDCGIRTLGAKCRKQDKAMESEGQGQAHSLLPQLSPKISQGLHIE